MVSDALSIMPQLVERRRNTDATNSLDTHAARLLAGHLKVEMVSCKEHERVSSRLLWPSRLRQQPDTMLLLLQPHVSPNTLKCGAYVDDIT